MSKVKNNTKSIAKSTEIRDKIVHGAGVAASYAVIGTATAVGAALVLPITSFRYGWRLASKAEATMDECLSK